MKRTRGDHLVVAASLILTLVGALLQGCSPIQDGTMSLDGTWLFKKDSSDVGVKEEWFAASSNRSGWTEIQVPDHWDRYNLEGYDGVGWYAREVTLTDTLAPMALFFGGVDDDAEVWINGNKVGEHTGYSEAFYFDVSHAVKAGSNEIVVRVQDNGGPGGIYKPVTLIPLNRVDELLRSKWSEELARPSADWVKNAVIYEVYLRSFSKEGTFKGLESKVPELRKLGVTVLWLMPIHPVGQANKKGNLGSSYSVEDYYEVNPEFGTLDDFKSLVNTVHENGLKIIIDLVANHAAWDSKLMFEHSDWFTTDDSGAVVSPNADWTDVADLNYGYHELRKYMIDMMEYWVREVGIDGFRCDVAEMVPTDFWEVARGELDKIKPVMMLSEGTLPEHHVKAFDITYSWGFYDVLSKVLHGSTPASVFSDLLRNESSQFPKGSLRLRFNSNHDKNYWDGPAPTRLGSDGAKATAVLTMTFPGIPLIYNGEEVGNDKPLNLFDKVSIDWTRDDGFRSLYAMLCSLRSDHIALRAGAYTALQNSDSLEVLAFERKDGTDRVVTAIRFRGKDGRVDIQLPSGAPVHWQEAITGEQMISQGGKISMTLSVPGYKILTPKD